MPYLSALEVCSRRGAIQIHVYLYLYCSDLYTKVIRIKVKVPNFHNRNNSGSVKQNNEFKFACSMRFSATADRMGRVTAIFVT